MCSTHKTADRCLSQHCPLAFYTFSFIYTKQELYLGFVVLNGVNMIYRAFCCLLCMMSGSFLICRIYVGFT